MKMRSGFKLVEIAGDYMVIPTGENIASFGGSVVLNEVSAFLLKEMQQDRNREQLLEKLLDAYEVSPETAGKDLDALIASLSEMELIEV